MDPKVIFYRYRILIAAMLISLFWHLFWLSAVKIVTAPGATKPIKFSKVSFLGPILERGAIELGLKPHDRSFLEKRYPLITYDMLNRPGQTGGADLEYGTLDDIRFHSDNKLEGLIGEAVRGDKLEPVYDTE